MNGLQITAPVYTPERRAEIKAASLECRALAARVHDLLPLHSEGSPELEEAQHALAVRQAQLSMVMTMAGYDALLASIDATKEATEALIESLNQPRRWWQFWKAPSASQSTRADGA